MTTALELWRAVVAGLREASYADIGPSYAALSDVLVQQRMTELLTGVEGRPEWAQLQKSASEARDLLAPIVEAAQRLAELPHEAVEPPPTQSPRKASPSRKPRGRQTKKE